MGPPAHILIVDDHEMLRRGVRSLLVEVTPRWEICGEAEDGKEAIEKVRDLKPDLVILDVSLPVVNGLEVARQIRELAPSVKILVFSMHDAPTVKAEFQRVGANAFVLKTAPSAELISTVARLLYVPRNEQSKTQAVSAD
jgi:DNA-binding NarL/FixJ family response regulator